MIKPDRALLHSHQGHTHAHPIAFFGTFDGRAILLSWIVFTVLLVSVPKFNLAGVIALASLPLVALLASGVPLGPVLKRLLWVSPFILLSAIANPFLDRTPFQIVPGLTVGAGVVSGLVIVLKASVSVLAVLTLSAAMPFDHLCHALRRLGAPAAFTTQLMMLHRYSFVLADEVRTLRLARDLRSFGGRGRGLKVTASLLGSLFLRTSWRAGRIHAAMLSRGFNGTVGCCQAERRFSSRDTLFLLAVTGTALFLRRFF